MNAIKFALLFLLLPTFSFAQGKVNWLSMEEALAKSKIEKKKIFVDVYTDWCGWCKKMEKVTFHTEKVALILNEDYYPVKFNAEQKEAISYNGKVYKYVGNGRNGHHELAAFLLDAQMSYPTVVFIDENLKVIQAIPGFRKKEEFALIANYFGKDFHKKISWEAFQKENGQ